MRRARSSSRPGAGPALDAAALPGADRSAPPAAGEVARRAGEVARRAGTHRGDGGRP
ncbi:hypothetical protein WMF37_32170 [Sorangium sp. So ce291]|uniref:hypothetical protein n=1 Tax=Sorangium sp. So ce291 TaxID=3133294 RepID=UPI003F5F703B